MGVPLDPANRMEVPLLSKFKSFFKNDNIKIDNPVFTLHHKVSFAVIFIGVLFTFGENYLVKEAITCTGSKTPDAFDLHFCWLHGGTHVTKEGQQQDLTKCRYYPKKEEPETT